ncbi:hypothetical protein P691DRAFT_784140 [Macrolepiota fuliginosa MF-IS2]|uniref:Uncharacterized protein n=1 Tax=Macrolepiota fuliginosa MF-IS2 TaxID=1400762 RepID=A0A9P5WX09_9AGAR|nr:hypothetical protein P691DRAFT_784140 [Macrolepiota fuliginosa MF-IS2]
MLANLEMMPTVPIDNWGGGSPTESTTNAMQTSIGEWMSPKDIDSIIDDDLYSKEEKLEIIFESYGVNNDQHKELLQYMEELAADILVFNDNSSQYGYTRLKNDHKYTNVERLPLSLIYQQLLSRMFREYAPDSKAVHSRTDYQSIGSEGVHFTMEEDEVSIDQTKVLTIVNTQSQQSKSPNKQQSTSKHTTRFTNNGSDSEDEKGSTSTVPDQGIEFNGTKPQNKEGLIPTV